MLREVHPAGSPVVMVDDSIAELCTPALEAAANNVYRVLFVRMLL